MVSVFGSPRRCGGQGDILSGSVAVFSSWAQKCTSSTGEASCTSRLNPMALGSIAFSALLIRKAASTAFKDKKRATLTSDIIEHLGKSLEDICPACVMMLLMMHTKEHVLGDSERRKRFKLFTM